MCPHFIFTLFSWRCVICSRLKCTGSSLSHITTICRVSVWQTCSWTDTVWLTVRSPFYTMTMTAFQNFKKFTLVQLPSGCWNSNNNLNLLFLYKLDVRTQLYITPNYQWNNVDCLYGSQPIVFITEQTTFIQSTTTQVYLIQLVITVPQIKSWSLPSISFTICYSLIILSLHSLWKMANMNSGDR